MAPHASTGEGAFLKWAFDLVVAATALIVLSPVLLTIAIIVKLDSPGPILFRQVRVGKDGVSFLLLKFRSMVVDAHRLAANVSPTGDPRVTRVGRFLRYWYLDELPQLWNVLRGDMSMVGPRPETPEFVARFSEEERTILTVRPGLVGPSTLAYMDEAEILAAAADAEDHYVNVVLHDRVRLDLRYLQDRSFGYDVRFLVRQALAILRQGLSGRRVARAAGWILIVAVLAAIERYSIGPDFRSPLGADAPWDLLPHVAAYAALTLALLLIAVPPGGERQAIRALVVSLSAVGLGVAMEVAQAAVHRDAQAVDVLANAVGVAAAVGAWALLRFFRSRPPARSTHAYAPGAHRHPSVAPDGPVIGEPPYPGLGPDLGGSSAR